MRDLKYIIIAIPGMERRAILFNGLFNHSDIWLGARRSIRGCELSSAGFCSLEGREVKTWGGSESLTMLLNKKIKCGMRDSEIIQQTLSRTFIL